MKESHTAPMIFIYLIIKLDQYFSVEFKEIKFDSQTYAMFYLETFIIRSWFLKVRYTFRGENFTCFVVEATSITKQALPHKDKEVH